MGKNRDGLSIVVDILNAAKPGCSKTHIMGQANLSFRLLEKYLTIVMELELIKIENCEYTLTDYGRDFLRRYRQFDERYSKANQTLARLISERQRLVRIFTKTNCISNYNGLSAR